MGDMISFDEARRRARPSYVDRESIEAACTMLEANVMEIVKGSSEAHGAIDPLAYEINAHMVAIRRALEVMGPPGSEGGEG